MKCYTTPGVVDTRVSRRFYTDSISGSATLKVDGVMLPITASFEGDASSELGYGRSILSTLSSIDKGNYVNHRG